MIRSSQKILLIMAIIIIAAFSTGCTNDKDVTTSPIPADKIILIEYHSNTFGEIINGTYPYFMYIDFPTYFINEEDKTLQSVFAEPMFEVNNSLIGVIGSGISLSGTAGGGASTWLYPAYSLPENAQEITLESVFENATVDIIYNNMSIRLLPNESYNKSYTRVQEDETEGWKCEMVTTDTIKNYGLIEKSNIIWESGY